MKMETIKLFCLCQIKMLKMITRGMSQELNLGYC